MQSRGVARSGRLGANQRLMAYRKHASGVPHRDKVATLSREDLRKIAELKMPDLNCTDIEAAMSMVAGTCRSMGVNVAKA